MATSIVKVKRGIACLNGGIIKECHGSDVIKVFALTINGCHMESELSNQYVVMAIPIAPHASNVDFNADQLLWGDF